MENKIYFYHNDNLLFESTNTSQIRLSNTKLNKIFKMAIKKRKIGECNNHFEYLTMLGYNLNKCGFCSNYAELNIVFEYTGNNAIVKEVDYPFYNYCKNRAKNCCGVKYNPNSVKFVSVTRNISDSDALMLIKQRNKSPFYKENFETDTEYRESQARVLSNFIKKYGKIDGTIKYEEYIKKLKYSHSEQYYIDKLGKEDGIKYWTGLSVKKDSMSLSYWTKRLGDEQLALEMHNKRLRETKRSLENYIRKYGEEQGIINYQISNSISNSSIKYFDELTTEIIKLGFINSTSDVQYGYKNEKAIYDNLSNTCYFYDYTIKKYRIIIEYNGIAWHPKEMYDSEFKHPHDKINSSAYYYSRDKHKLDIARKYNYNVIVVWEDDKDKINFGIQEITKVINERTN